MPVNRTMISGSPYLGVYLRVIERAALVPPSIPSSLERDVERLCGVRATRTTIFDTELLGSLVALNSFGAVVGDRLDRAEREAVERIAPVTEVEARQNALGNNVLANDQGALVHPEYSDALVERIGRALGVPAHRGTVAGLGTVGMAAIATNRGAVAHPRITEREAEVMSRALRVPVHRSTANFGVPVVGACLVANSRGFLVGRPTTPVELVHLQEGLQIFD